VRIKKKKVLITKRDEAMFRFIWKWKLLTTSALARKFFPTTSVETARQRLMFLNKGGYLIRLGNVAEASVFWSLTNQGFEFIEEELPDLREIGFRSEAMIHDSLCSALQLGEWLTHVPEGADLFSEQELRRLPLESYPHWVPTTDQHRSDGYWRTTIDGEPTTIALEVEITIKRDSDYYRPAHFYDRQKSIYCVVWLVDNLKSAKRIQEKLKSFCEPSHQIHNFLTRSEFESKGWDAKFCLGSQNGQSVGALIDSRAAESAAAAGPTGSAGRPPDASRISSTLALLDSSKTACKTDPYRSPQNDKNRNRLGIQPSLDPLLLRAYVDALRTANLEHICKRLDSIEALIVPNEKPHLVKPPP
jgi:hypothetical protein